MASWTLSQLMTRVRERADMVNSKFISDDELKRYISASYAELYDLVVGAYEDHYLSDPVSFTISSGANTYDLDANFYKLVGVDYSLNGEWVEIRPFNFNERNRKSYNVRYDNYHPSIRYRLTGSKLRFVPTDEAAGTYRYWYIPLASTLTADADTIDGFNGWEEYVVIDAAIKCLTKEESDVTVLMVEKNAMKERILSASHNRDSGDTQRVTDVRRSYDDHLFYNR